MRIGESLEKFTMKEPKLKNLKFDMLGTARMRKAMKNTKKIRITINLDSDLLSVIKEMAMNRGAPYQSLINRLLRLAAMESGKGLEESRIEKIEKDLAFLKKKIA